MLAGPETPGLATLHICELTAPPCTNSFLQGHGRWQYSAGALLQSRQHRECLLPPVNNRDLPPAEISSSRGGAKAPPEPSFLQEPLLLACAAGGRAGWHGTAPQRCHPARSAGHTAASRWRTGATAPAGPASQPAPKAAATQTGRQGLEARRGRRRSQKTCEVNQTTAEKHKLQEHAREKQPRTCKPQSS